MKNTIKFIICFAIIAVTVLPFGTSAENFPNETMNSYTYDYWGEGVISPDCYNVEKISSVADTTGLNAPADMYITENGDVYIADSGNNRIVVLDINLTFKKEYREFTLNGEKTTLNNPSGVFVDKNGNLTIADTQNRRVLKVDSNGEVLLVLSKPDKDFNFTGIDYLPTKIIEDSNGCVYVLCNGIFQGAMMYEPDGEFIGYYGANDVEVTLSVAVETLWRKFMTKEQRLKATNFVPIEFDNMFIDDEGFIYTVTTSVSTDKNQIRKLNPKGDNILPVSTAVAASYAGVYGDLKPVVYNGVKSSTRFTDITVDQNGFISAIDEQRGRIFQYDSEGNLIIAFGGLGSQSKTFGLPSAIESYNDKLYVLDNTKNNIMVLSLTGYGEILHKAILEYNNGNYTESEELWQEVLRQNDNFNLAYIGMGKIYHEKKEYKKAMEYFEIGGDRTNYANSFKYYRNIALRKYVFPAAGILIVLLILFKIIRKITNRIKGVNI